MITVEQIQNKLAKAIKQSGLTQTELSRLVGIKPTTISQYLSGRTMPALDTFANICVVLDVDANEILCLI